MFIKDLVERTVATYAQAFLGLLLASWSDAIDVSTLRAAAVAAIPAALAVVKGFAAKSIGDPDSAALIGEYDPHTPD